MKKSFKAVLAAALIGAMTLALAGCGGNKGGNAGDANKNAASGKDAAVTGEVISNENYSALCPEGFLNIPQYNVFGEQDADGNYPLSETNMVFCYGGKSEFDMFTKPCVNVTLLESSIDGVISMMGYVYDEMEEVTFTVNGADVRGVKATSETTDGNAYTYDIAFIEVGETGFQVSVVTSTPENGDSGINMDSASIQAICESLAVK